MTTPKIWFALATVAILPTVGAADVIFYGDQDVLGWGSYASDPTAGATVEGLAPGQVTSATSVKKHGYPFDPGLLTPDHVLTLSIDQGLHAGDGWAVDYLSVGVTTKPMPEPATWALLLTGLVGFGLFRRRER